MKLAVTTAIAASFALAACAPNLSAPEEPKAEATEESTGVEEEAIEVASLAAETEVAPRAASDDPRAVGDYVTYTFTGAYRNGPLRLTQTVVARDAGAITIDYAFTEAKKTDTLRVTMRTEGRARGAVVEVARILQDGSAAPATAADLDARMAATAAVADENEALVDETRTTVRVGEAEIAATKSTYKVRVGAKAATLETMTAGGFGWGDLGGKITTADGKVLFQAELVDAGGPWAKRASLD